jgi:hypothetical protein
MPSWRPPFCREQNGTALAGPRTDPREGSAIPRRAVVTARAGLPVAGLSSSERADGPRPPAIPAPAETDAQPPPHTRYLWAMLLARIYGSQAQGWACLARRGCKSSRFSAPVVALLTSRIEIPILPLPGPDALMCSTQHIQPFSPSGYCQAACAWDRRSCMHPLPKWRSPDETKWNPGRPPPDRAALRATHAKPSDSGCGHLVSQNSTTPSSNDVADVGYQIGHRKIPVA